MSGDGAMWLPHLLGRLVFISAIIGFVYGYWTESKFEDSVFLDKLIIGLCLSLAFSVTVIAIAVLIHTFNVIF